MAIYNETFVSGGNRYISLMSMGTFTLTAAACPQKVIKRNLQRAEDTNSSFSPPMLLYEDVLKNMLCPYAAGEGITCIPSLSNGDISPVTISAFSGPGGEAS